MKRIGLAASIAVYLLVVALQVRQASNVNGGHFIYPIDDTYIHMAIAKNFATHGVWGVTPHHFSSTSSSPLYTLLLAALYFIAGPGEYWPLFLNIIFGIGLLLFLGKIAMEQGLTPFAFFCLAVATIFLTPLPALAVSGMEHTAQLLIDLAFLYYATKGIAAKERFTRRHWYGLFALAFLCTFVRYEGLFLAGITGVLFALKKQFKTAALVVGFGLLPVVLFGLLSLQKGGYFLPNSILLKGQTPSAGLRGLAKLASQWMVQLLQNPHLLFTFFTAAGYCIYANQKKPMNLRDVPAVWSLVLLLLCVAHLMFARTGWFFRYEAYLVLLTFALCIWLLKGFRLSSLQKSPLIAALFVVAFLPVLYALVRRGKDAFKTTVPATQDIYRQQYQMARFFGQYYPGQSIALNDIGAVSFYNDVRLLDLVGLGSDDVLRLKRSNRLTKDAVRGLAAANGVKVAMIYDSWFPDLVPVQWRLAGRWRLPCKTIVGDSIVSIYATEAGDGCLLKKQLKDFAPKLPAVVIQEGDYLKASPDSVACAATVESLFRKRK